MSPMHKEWKPQNISSSPLANRKDLGSVQYAYLNFWSPFNATILPLKSLPMGTPRFYEQQERMRIDSSQADERASKAAMSADLNITGEVPKINLTLFYAGVKFNEVGIWHESIGYTCK